MNQPDLALENTFSITRHLAFNKYRGWTILLILSGCSLFIYSVFFNAVFGPVVIFLLIAYSVFLYKKAEGVFMQDFARLNNLDYAKVGSLKTVSGRIFEMGHSKKMSHVLSGSYADRPMRLFYFRYSVGSGKSERTYNYTVCEIEFKKTKFPYLLLRSRSMYQFGVTDFFKSKGDIELSLEEDFAKTFRLLTRQGYEVEALQIFSFDTLHFLKDKAHKFSVEFAGNKMYIYDDLHIGNKTDLAEIYSVTQKMIDSVGPLLDRLHDDYFVLDEVYSKK